MILIRNCKFELGYQENDIEKLIRKKLKGVGFISWKYQRRSLDCRKKDSIHYVISLLVDIGDEAFEEKVVKRVNDKNITLTKPVKYSFPYRAGKDTPRPIVIGTGPAGYFAAYMLSSAGFKPIVLERGKAVEERTADVEAFWDGGKLNPDSNVSFGEGGAGTFSDGKLNTGNKDKGGYFSEVMNIFYKMGAKENVLYDAKPHVGTDVLKSVMQNMREFITSHGGEILFGHKVTDISPENEEYLVTCTEINGKTKQFRSKGVILAIGHSARDTFHMLINKGFTLTPKPYAMGLRIEHSRDMIDEAMYGRESLNKFKKLLPAADYKLTYHAENGRNVFSFCMCPGGYVVNASSEEQGTVVNGMSYSDRDGKNSNSAIVVSVTPEDYGGDTPEDAIHFQMQLENRFKSAGDGSIPVQLLGDFCEGRKSDKLGKVEPQIKGRYTFSEISGLLPKYISDAIIEAMPSFGRTIKGFDRPDSVLSGIESRTSSPVRIDRDENMMALHFPGLIPAGEGAGYAGGITSAAADGIKAAEALGRYLTESNIQ